MKKIVLNISDVLFEKFRFEAIHERKSIQEVIKTRLEYKPFHIDVEEAFDQWETEQLQNLMNEPFYN